VRLVARYEALAVRYRTIAAAYADALIDGRVHPGRVDVARGEMRQARQIADRYADAGNLRRRQIGEPVQAWPSVAPWAGF
jgi:hypothetical protein